LIRKVMARISEFDDVSQFDALEVFAREGKWQLRYMAERVASITAWEYSEGFREGLEQTLAEAGARHRVAICDSFEEIKKPEYRDAFDLVSMEGPITCHGHRVEHHDLFPAVFRVLKDRAWLLPEIFTDVDHYRQRQNRAMVERRVKDARRKFYELPGDMDGTVVPVGHAVAKYRKLAEDAGFKVLRHFSMPRNWDHGDMWYVAMALERA